MKYAIYQINRERDTDRLLFQNYERTMREAGRINLEIYDKVYEGETEKVGTQEEDELTLERIYFKFNTNKRPSDFKGHSISVSDVVELNGAWWFCDSIGWERFAP